MPLAKLAQGVPGGGGIPGASASLGQAPWTSPVGDFCQVWGRVWSTFQAALLLSSCIHCSYAQAPRSFPAVAALSKDAVLNVAPASPAVAQAAQVQRIAPPDARALEKLWEGWGRDRRLEGWGSPWLCNATGLECSARGRVSALRLPNRQLRGTMASAIGTLLSLRFLDLSYNQLAGTLPSSIGRMSSLNSLALRNNLLTGTLPTSIGGMRSLNSLDLEYNLLTGSLPSSIGRMTRLESLSLYDNQLTGSLPSSVMGMDKLQSLVLRNNKLTGNLPSSVAGMSSLIFLDLSNNQLTGSLPSSIGRMTSLTRLILNDNQLTGSLPASFLGMHYLNALDLSRNQLTETVPSSIGQMISLEYLYLDDNQLTGGLPSIIGGMTNLKVLDLCCNQLTGSVPSNIGGLIRLIRLKLTDNQLTGSLPSSLGGMNSLTALNLSRNQLTGSVPSIIGRLISLEYLYLNGNLLTGSLPSSLGRMSSLAHLDVSSNRLTGSILPSTGGMNRLALLDLSNNLLSGEVPVSLSGLFGLSHLDLGHNPELEASTSSVSGLAGLSRLQHLGLALPGLSAPLESLQLPLGSLTFLSLKGANVSGTVSDSPFDASSGIESLILQGTAIQGVLPTGMALLSSLSVMTLPGRVLCPPGSCKDPTVARNQAFCARCTAFCATCPPAASFRDSQALLLFQAASGNFPGYWTNSSFQGVSLDKNGHVQAIWLSSDKLQDLGLELRFDMLPRATLRTLIFSSASSPGSPIGTLSATLSCLSSLRQLDVSQVVGPEGQGMELPLEALGHLRSLTALDVSNSILPGGDPPATLVGLCSLGMSNCLPDSNSFEEKLTAVPSHVSRFTNLTQLDLSENTIQGSIPSFLSSLRLLANLDLSGNKLEGSVPESLSLLANLTALNLGKNAAQLSLPPGLSTLPLVYLIVDQWKCLNHSGGTPCPNYKVNPSSPFCKRYCPHICIPCYPPPSPSPPPSPPPAFPPPSPPLSPPSDGNVGVIAGAASAAGFLVLVTALALWYLLIRKKRRSKDDDDIEKRGVKSLSAEEVDEMTASFGSFIGGEGGTELYAGETAQEQGVKVWVRESGRGRDRKAAEKAFRQEVWLLSGIHHRSLQELYGYCLTPGRLFLVYESPEQGSLWGLLRQDPASLTWSRRLRIALTAAMGLDYMHSQLDPPLVHKDVKSRSILVTAEFEGKVGAAGLGALEFGDEGSLGYADPSKGEQGSPTAKCDVYAFGVVLLELATGIPPLEGETHILSRVLEMTTSEEGLQRGIPLELQGERQKSAQVGRAGNDADIAELGRAPLLTLEAFECLLELGVSCCSFKPQDRPSMAQVSFVIEELLHGKILPAASFRAPGQVPFPEYAEPVRGPMGPTELLAISFTISENCPSLHTSTSLVDRSTQSQR